MGGVYFQPQRSVAPSGFKMQNIHLINFFNARIKLYFFKGLESAMLLKDLNDDLLFHRICLHFNMKLSQILDQSSGVSHDSYFKDKRVVFPNNGLTTLPQIFIQLLSHHTAFARSYFIRITQKRKTLRKIKKKFENIDEAC